MPEKFQLPLQSTASHGKGSRERWENRWVSASLWHLCGISVAQMKPGLGPPSLAEPVVGTFSLQSGQSPKQSCHSGGLWMPQGFAQSLVTLGLALLSFLEEPLHLGGWAGPPAGMGSSSLKKEPGSEKGAKDGEGSASVPFAFVHLFGATWVGARKGSSVAAPRSSHWAASARETNS